ncbi:MAG TPA: hypothetical protein PKJ19_15720, partial [Flavobacteriales bacterium]|nr:hypothetical protein [Flavobacteriales bacterium]
MSQRSYVENVNNSPYGLANTNAPGSPYAAAYSRGVTNHLMLPVDPIIFDAEPQQFLDLQYLMAFASKEVPGDELIWHEDVWSRSPIVTRASFAGVAATPGTNVTGAIPITAASLPFVFPGQQLYYRGTNDVYASVVVVSVTSTGGSEAITVRSQTGQPIPPITTVGTAITNGMTFGADGQSTFTQPTRLQTVQRTNLIEKIGPEEKIWNHLERIKWRNQSQTNFIERDMKAMLTQLKVSLCQRIWIGKYGENLGLESAIGKNTEGIVPAIQNNGGATLNSTMSTVWDDLTTGIFATNFGPVSNERVVFGTPEMLHAMNVKQKAEFVRYGSGDKVFDLDFETWRFGGQTLTLVPT